MGRDIEERLAWRNKTPFSPPPLPPPPPHPLTLPCDKLSQQVLHSARQPGGNGWPAEPGPRRAETLLMTVVPFIFLTGLMSVRAQPKGRSGGVREGGAGGGGKKLNGPLTNIDNSPRLWETCGAELRVVVHSGKW